MIVPDEKVLYKVTRMTDTHNGEEKYIDFLNTQNDYVAKLYKETIKNINENDTLLEYITENIKKYDNDNINNLFYKNIKTEYKISGYFVENAGGTDLFDTLTDLINLDDNIWINDTKSKVFGFVYQMCKCLEYLQANKMGHFDIKPENIMYNDHSHTPFGKRFKLIDFGFADKYPFEKYSNRMSGTPLYTPCYLKNHTYPAWALKIRANDWLYNPMRRKYYHYICYNYFPELIYKTDVFSMGVVFNQLLYYINDYVYRSHNRTFQFRTIKTLVTNMTHKDIVSRYYSVDCINDLDEYLEDDNSDNNCFCLKKCLKN